MALKAVGVFALCVLVFFAAPKAKPDVSSSDDCVTFSQFAETC